MTDPLIRPDSTILSPLRYPGGKRRLWGYIAEALRLNSIVPDLFIEPFAGGASISLQLLKSDLVKTIGLGEKDPLVSAFWQIVFSDAEWLIGQIRNLEITVEKWEELKRAEPTSVRERALKCLFLNRTSFSGIIAPGAGPIGGKSQRSKYGIDCRFPIETVIRRIQEAYLLRDRVRFVICADWQETIEGAELSYGQHALFYYLDPPFFHKSHRLYTEWFTNEEHVRLHDFLSNLDRPWLLSYDDAQLIAEMYSDNGPLTVELLYSAAGSPRLVRAKELIISNLSVFPKESRVWRTSAEWKSS